MCTFSKTISNGFAMAAVIGRRDVMAPAAASFISTTYHTERIGPAAAIATIKKMRESGAIEHNNAMGRLIKEGLLSAANKTGLEIQVSGIDCWASFKFGKDTEAVSIAPKPQSGSPMMTLYTQEMLKRGFLSYGTSMPTFAHKQKHSDMCLNAAEDVFGILARWRRAERGDETKMVKYLQGPIAGPPAIPKRLVR